MLGPWLPARDAVRPSSWRPVTLGGYSPPPSLDRPHSAPIGPARCPSPLYPAHVQLPLAHVQDPPAPSTHWSTEMSIIVIPRPIVIIPRLLPSTIGPTICLSPTIPAHTQLPLVHRGTDRQHTTRCYWSSGILHPSPIGPYSCRSSPPRPSLQPLVSYLQTPRYSQCRPAPPRPKADSSLSDWLIPSSPPTHTTPGKVSHCNLHREPATFSSIIILIQPII